MTPDTDIALIPTRSSPALRDMRLALGLSRTELARRLEISCRTIQALETGRYVPSVTLAVRLARELEHPVETVFTL